MNRRRVAVKDKAVSRLDGIDADLVEWVRVGDLLSRLEPERFARLLALGQSYASTHDDELEDRKVFEARLSYALGGKPSGSPS